MNVDFFSNMSFFCDNKFLSSKKLVSPRHGPIKRISCGGRANVELGCKSTDSSLAVKL